MGLVYLVQHADKQPEPGDPGLTDEGLRQAERTGRWLTTAGLAVVYSSPLRRARQTAHQLAAATGLEVRPDDRLRERMNWDGTQSIEDFRSEWVRSVHDRDFVPRAGDSSRQAAARMLAFVEEQLDATHNVAAVTHGGVTVDLLRTLLGDHAVPADLVHHGIPPCAITVLTRDGVTDIARTDHLR